MPDYPSEVQAIVTFEIDARAAVQQANRAAERLASVHITGQRIAVHLERLGVPPHAGPPR